MDCNALVVLIGEWKRGSSIASEGLFDLAAIAPEKRRFFCECLRFSASRSACEVARWMGRAEVDSTLRCSKQSRAVLKSHPQLHPRFICLTCVDQCSAMFFAATWTRCRCCSAISQQVLPRMSITLQKAPKYSTLCWLRRRGAWSINSRRDAVYAIFELGARDRSDDTRAAG